MRHNVLTFGIAALVLAMVALSTSASAQSFSFLGTNLLNEAKNLQPFTTNRAALFQAGAGINTGDKKLIVAGALTIPTSEYTAVGVVGGWTPGAGFEYGAATLQVGVTNNLEVAMMGFDIGLGQVHSFIEDGPVHNWRSGATGNFFGAGMEKSWTISKYVEAGGGIFVDNDTTRSGMDIIGGAHLQVHGANATPLNLHATAAHGMYAVKRFLNPGEF
jgi:hypothetical protein